jgi:hypothetical protein
MLFRLRYQQRMLESVVTMIQQIMLALSPRPATFANLHSLHLHGQVTTRETDDSCDSDGHPCAGACTRPFLSSTSAVCDAKYTLDSPHYPLTSPKHPLNVTPDAIESAYDEPKSGRV